MSDILKRLENEEPSEALVRACRREIERLRADLCALTLGAEEFYAAGWSDCAIGLGYAWEKWLKNHTPSGEAPDAG